MKRISTGCVHSEVFRSALESKDVPVVLRTIKIAPRTEGYGVWDNCGTTDKLIITKTSKQISAQAFFFQHIGNLKVK